MKNRLFPVVIGMLLLFVASCGGEDSLETKCNKAGAIALEGIKEFCAGETCCACECIINVQGMASPDPCTCSDVSKEYKLSELPGPQGGEPTVTCTLTTALLAIPEDKLDWCVDNPEECKQSAVDTFEGCAS